MQRLILICGLLAAGGPVFSQQAVGPPSSANGVVRMTPQEIKNYNANLAKSDTAYIKCVRTQGPGSLVKRRVCRTNEDWDKRAVAAAQEARDIVDYVQTHGSSNSVEPAGSIGPAIPM